MKASQSGTTPIAPTQNGILTEENCITTTFNSTAEVFKLLTKLNRRSKLFAIWLLITLHLKIKKFSKFHTLPSKIILKIHALLEIGVI